MLRIHCILLIGLFPVLFTAHLICQDSLSTVVIVKEIKIVGNRSTKNYVILREMSTKPGDTLRQESLERDQNNIYNLGLFNKVDVDYNIKEDSAIVYVVVYERWYLIPYPVLGMKYRDPSKLYYGAGFMHQNFRGRNEKLNTEICFGYDKWVSLGYSNPKITYEDDLFLGGIISVQKLHDLSKNFMEYENSNVFFSLTGGKRFGLYKMLLGYLSYEIWQVSKPELRRTLSSTGRDAFISCGIQYRYDTRNNREYTTDGTLVSIVASKVGFGESDVDYSRLALDLRRFFGFGEGVGLGVRGYCVFLIGGAIPSYKHVFFGYDERIRGYFYDIYEGENRMGANLELRYPIFLPRYLDLDFIKIPEFKKLRFGLYVGIFADVGKIWCRNESVRNLPWYSGYGAGLQFLLPYAFTIRLEAALNNFGKLQGLIDFDTSF